MTKVAKYGALLMLAAVICPYPSVSVLLWITGVAALSFGAGFWLSAPPESSDKRQ